MNTQAHTIEDLPKSVLQATIRGLFEEKLASFIEASQWLEGEGYRVPPDAIEREWKRFGLLWKEQESIKTMSIALTERTELLLTEWERYGINHNKDENGIETFWRAH